MSDKKTRSRFLRVKCADCGNEQIIFGSAATTIKCLVCEKLMATSRSGRAEIKGQVVDIVDKDI